jgi:hypothetical protein
MNIFQAYILQASSGLSFGTNHGQMTFDKGITLEEEKKDLSNLHLAGRPP